MKKTLRLASVIALVAVFASVATFANGRDLLRKPQIPNVGEGELYRKSDIFPAPVDTNIVPMETVDLGKISAFRAQQEAKIEYQVQPGPITIADNLTPTTTASQAAIPGGTSANFLTPERQTRMEIRRLIKKLN